MAEVQSRPRGGGRAGRGGRSSRGGDRSVSKQGSGDPSASVPLEEQGELGQLKKQYMTQLVTLRELFPDWTDEDCVFALQESDGDLQTTIEKISEGAVSQFSDVKKKTREKPKTKTADSSLPAKDAKESTASATRGRGRGGLEPGRGGRGRGAERSRGRGTRGSTSHGPRQSVPSTTTTVAATESTSWADSMNQAPVEPSWDTSAAATTGAGSTEGQWGSVVASSATPATASEGQKSSLIPEGATKSWASIAQPKPAPVVPKQPLPAETLQPLEPPIALEIPALIEKPATPPGLTRPTNVLTPQASSEGTMDLTPPKDQLTEDNLENLPDTSVPPSSETVASTRDPRSAAGTPYASGPQAPISRPGLSGYAASAWKATAVPGRSASFQRRMMEQREAVVMPGNHAVNNTVLQFGSMNLNGDAKPLDVDEDREEPETRTQPPQQSPSQPRASLPPAPYHQQAQPPPEASVPEGLPTPKQSTLQQAQSSALGQQPSPSAGLGPQISGQPTTQAGQAYGQYSRYGAATLGQEHQAPTPKPYDPFSSQLNHPQLQQEQHSAYPSHSQPSSQATQHAQTAISQPPGDFASQYPSEQRGNFSNFYGSSYGQQAGSGQDQTGVSQRSGSGFGANEGYGGSTQTQVPSRLGDAQNSGSNTPNPPPMGSQSHQTQQMHQQHGQGSHAGAYPYPYYSGYGSYGSYMNQFPNQYSYNQQGYAAQFGSKGGMYNQSHHGYGMSPQTSFEHSSSPANAGGYGSSMMHGRDSGLSGFNEYSGRSGSAQQSQGAHQSASAGSFGGMGESYGRSSSGAFQNQQYGIPSTGVTEETLKPFAEPKSGPSPALGQPGRPPSGLNASASGGQSNLPPGQSQHSFSAGYPSHLQQQLHGSHGSQQYGGLGGLGGGHQGGAASHQGGNYGGYGSGFSSSYGNYGRGGWGNNYGH